MTIQTPHIHTQTFVALACLIATGALLGLSTILAKTAPAAGLAPLPFLTWSIIGAALILLLRGAVRRQLPHLTRRTGEYFIIAALISLAAPNFIVFAAAPEIGASFVSLAIALPPALTYLGALVLGVERFVFLRAVGVALALSGTGLIALMNLDMQDSDAGWIALTLLCPVLLAAGNLYRTLRWPPGETPDRLAPGMLAGAAGLLLGAGIIAGAAPALPSSPAAIGLTALQSGVFALQYVLFFVLQKSGGPVYLSLIGSVAALVAVPFAILILGEVPPDGLFFGALLIGAGVVLLSRAPGSARQARKHGS